MPFRRDSDEARLWAHLSEPPPKPTELVPEIPHAFDAVVERALAKDPEERYQSAGDLGRAALAAAANQQPAERERLVAKGAAAPVESPTVTAAARPRRASQRPPRDAETQLQPEAETAPPRAPESAVRRPSSQRASCSSPRRRLRRALARRRQTAATKSAQGTPTPDATATATPNATPSTEDGQRRSRSARRPNVVRAAGDNVFVGSFRKDRMSIVDAKTGKVRAYAPHVGVGLGRRGRRAATRSGWPSSRANQLVRLDARTGRPIGDPIKIAVPP